MSDIPRKTTPSSADLMPAPFEWIDIPGDTGRTWTLPPYKIAKYPITNAQFKLFIDAGGYGDPRWWTEAGWTLPSKTGLVQPSLYHHPRWNTPDQPVVGVSWHEAIAFCRWLSYLTDENITLPTEDEWQYAAQGDDDRTYAWGDGWDPSRCHHSVPPSVSEATVAVTQFETRGGSFFGAADIAGNVEQWCLTLGPGSRDGFNETETRVVRGSSWNGFRRDMFACDLSTEANVESRTQYIGFRICRH